MLLGFSVAVLGPPLLPCQSHWPHSTLDILKACSGFFYVKYWWGTNLNSKHLLLWNPKSLGTLLLALLDSCLLGVDLAMNFRL